MNVLILGSGGREHTLAWKVAQSKKVNSLFVAPGNGGTSGLADNISITVNDFPNIERFIREKDVRMIIVGPEDPLVNGIRDHLESNPDLNHLIIIGPGKSGAQLEGSKDFSKSFMQKNGIPTAKASTFDQNTLDDGFKFIDNMQGKIVLKADGLAAGKGVIICEDKSEAKETLSKMINNQLFGEASSKVLIEEYLSGIELSVFIITNGKQYKILPEAKDYKRIGENDTGPNTGGMGAISPVTFADADFMEKVEKRIIIPTLNGLQNENIPYLGFLFIGLMNVDGDPYVIEYNVRMGDPETQVVLPRIRSDFVELLLAARNGTLDACNLEVRPEYASTVVMVSGGYPGAYEKGKVINGLDLNLDAQVFHAGTKLDNGRFVTNGGRVLALTGIGPDQEAALKMSYNAARMISWDGVYFRRDIGVDL